jgi:hypothetical protein
MKMIIIFIFDHYVLISYDKLVMYGFWVHGCNMDSVSHYVMYVKVVLDKAQKTIFEPFKVVVSKFGTPLWVWLDFAIFEHAFICQLMEEAQLETRNPFLVGSFLSTINYHLCF